MKTYLYILLVLWIGLIACQSSKPETPTPEPKPISITILHTNDHHGHFFASDSSGQTNAGGMPARQTLAKEVRQEVEKNGGHLLILDCGDINTGNPESNLLLAEPDIDMMNRIGYKAMATGNHEFDLTIENLEKQRGWAKFPYLCANVFRKDTGELLLPSHCIFEYQGLKVAVFGIVAPYTPSVSTNGNDPRLKFELPEKVLPELLAKLKSQSDFIIGLMHTDHSEAVELAKKFPDIGLIIGGHNHIPMLQPELAGNTPVVQAYYYSLVVGRFDLQFQNKKLTNWKYEPIGINISQPILDDFHQVGCKVYNRKFDQDPELTKLAEEYKSKTAFLREVIAEATEDMPSKSSAKFCSSPLGNFISDAMRLETQSDIALQNTGGIRGDLLAGKITRADMLRILPFANNIVTYNITGEQLLKVIDQWIANSKRGKGMLEISGMTIKIRDRKAQDIFVGGKPFSTTATYRVAVNSFTAGGGDKYEMFKDWAGQDTGKSVAEVVTQYLQKNSPIKPNAEMRIGWED